MSSHRLAYVAALLCATAGIATALVRRDSRAHGPVQSVWRLRYDISLESGDGGARLRLALPNHGHGRRVLREQFWRPTVLMDVVRNRTTGGREAIAVAPAGAERIDVAAEFDIQLDRDAPGIDAERERPLPAALRAVYLRAEENIPVAAEAVTGLVARLARPGKPKSELLDAVFAHCANEFAEGTVATSDDALEVIGGAPPSALGRARAFVAMCRTVKIPARLVTGFVLEHAPRARPHVWVELHRKKRWVPYDPLFGFAGRLPRTHIAVRRGGWRVAHSSGARSLTERYSVVRCVDEPGGGTPGAPGVPSVFDLRRLPPGMQSTLTLVLLLPVAALITALFRVVVGLQTFGTFTPGLLALSFVYSDWRTGAVMFVSVVAVGVGGRTALERLRLLAVPRAGIVLTFVVLTLSLAVSTFDYLGWTPSARAVLLPTVVLTMIVERMHVTSVEDGPRHSLVLLVGTLVVALVCVVVLRTRSIGRFVLTYPESLLCVVALLVLAGRYTGYRLTELWRFRDMNRLARNGGAP